MKKDLGEGLVLRSLSEGMASDKENIGEFYLRVFTESENRDLGAFREWIDDLMDASHPTTTLEDIWVVVDTNKQDVIVSALLIIPQTWRYEDIEIGVGRVELVATDKDYRRRGLIRKLMDAAHERSAALGHLVQGITGIPHYYRRFGYSMAVDLGARSGVNLSAIADLKEGDTPKFTLRPVTNDDIPDLMAFDNYYAQGCLLSMVRTAEEWYYELNQRTSLQKFNVLIVVNDEAESIGYLAVQPSDQYPSFYVLSYIIGEKSSYLMTFDDVMRGIKQYIDTYYADKPDLKPTRIGLDSGHSVFLDKIIRKVSSGVVRDSVYAWYMRVKDVGALLRHLAPVLERRLEGSGANRYTGELKIAFYDLTGVTLTFEAGKLTSAKQVPMHENDAHAAFPYYYFLDVIFGRRSVDEITHIMPEARANRNATILLDALFPKKRSWLMALA